MRFLNQKAQSTAEYAIIIAVVIGALVVMQTYIKRGMQGKFKDAVGGLTSDTETGATFNSTTLALTGFGIGQYDQWEFDKVKQTAKIKSTREKVIDTYREGTAQRIIQEASPEETQRELISGQTVDTSWR